MTKVFLYFNTIRFLKLRQIIYRLYFKVNRVKLSNNPAPKLSTITTKVSFL